MLSVRKKLNIIYRIGRCFNNNTQTLANFAKLVNCDKLNVRYIFTTKVQFLDCWSCKEKLSNESVVFCDQCHSIQKCQLHHDYFRLLKLKESFDVDKELLSKAYRQLQMIFHPDRFSTKSKEEQEIAEEWSSMINNAYKTLLNAESRGWHILNLRGFVSEDEKEGSIINESGKDTELLMMVMERNEQVDEAKKPEELDAIATINKTDIDNCLIQISSAFIQNNLELAKQQLIKLKYFMRIAQKINNKRLFS